MILTAMLILALALPAPAAFAPGDPGQAPPRKEARTQGAPDESFMAAAAQGDAFEVEAGALAAQRTARTDVLRYAGRMVNDHSLADLDLRNLASLKGFALPAAPSAQDQERLRKLRAAAAEEFDAAYMEAMVSAHELAARDFQAYLDGGKDPDLKAWATLTLPTLEKHLVVAQEIYKDVMKR